MRDKKINLELTGATRQVIQRYNLDPTKMEFWREGYTVKIRYRARLFKVVEASTDIEDGSSNASLMTELCEEIIRKIR